MKKITDERLVLQNLKNIRIAYIVQTTGILAILGYDWATKGIDGMTDNPLWYVFILTAIVSAYLSMSISVDHENKKADPKKSLILSLVVLSIITIGFGYLASMGEGSTMSGVLIGGIIFICGLIPILYIYKLRVNRQNENIDDDF